MANINDFKATFAGGVRPNLFRVNIFNTAGVQLHKTEMLVKATSLPGQTVPAFDVPYRGRQLKVAGDRTFDDWTVTFLNDAGWQNRNAMERWMQAISAFSVNSSSIPFSNHYGTAIATQLTRGGAPLRTYRLDVLPTALNAIEVDSSTNDSVEEFEVTFAVNYFTIDGLGTDAGAISGSPGSSGGTSVSGSIQIANEIGNLTVNAGTII